MSSLRLPDIVIFLTAAAVTVFCAYSIYGKSSAAVQFIIQGKEGSWVYPVSQTVRMDIAGPLGNTVVELADSRALVVSSPCANKLCVASGAIRHRGQWIACLPNAVFVRIESAGGKQTDAEIDAEVW